MTRAIIPAFLFLMALTTSAQSTTWTQGQTEDDPFSDGECVAEKPGSWGSYIYDWPSKYDGVYWPFTASPWVWYCPSGYVSFGSYFDNLSTVDRKAVGALLDQRRDEWGDLENLENRITALEQIFEVREFPLEDRAHHLRALADWRVDDVDTADSYRKRAMPLLKEMLEDVALTGLDRIQALYLMGFYSHRFDDAEASAEYFEKARALEWEDENGEKQVGSPYFNDLINVVESGALNAEGRTASDP